MDNFKEGDIVQQFDGYGHPSYKDGKPIIRTCISYNNYKNDITKYESLSYVTVETCISEPKKFKKLDVGFRPYRLSHDLNKKELVIVQEITKELGWNPNFLEQIAAVENTDVRYLSERERGIVLSVIQWMGTNVGSSFLERVDTTTKELDITSELV